MLLFQIGNRVLDKDGQLAMEAGITNEGILSVEVLSSLPKSKTKAEDDSRETDPSENKQADISEDEKQVLVLVS